MRLKGSYFVLAPKVEPSLIGSWRIWKIGKFCVLKGAVNLWCSAQRDRLSEGRVHQYISHLTFVIFYFFDCFPFKQCDTLKTIRRGFHVWKEFNWRKSTFWMSSFTFLNFTKQFVDLFTVRIFSGKQEDFIIFAEGENTNLTFFDFRWVRNSEILSDSELTFCQHFGTKYWVWKMPCLQKNFSSQTEGNKTSQAFLWKKLSKSSYLLRKIIKPWRWIATTTWPLLCNPTEVCLKQGPGDSG